MTKNYAKPLTPEEISALPDDQIDTSDIPELDKDFWKNAKIAPPRTKPNVSLQLSEEIVAFIKAENPKGYTARMAAVLSAYVNAHRQDD